MWSLGLAFLDDNIGTLARLFVVAITALDGRNLLLVGFDLVCQFEKNILNCWAADLVLCHTVRFQAGEELGCLR